MRQLFPPFLLRRQREKGAIGNLASEDVVGKGRVVYDVNIEMNEINEVKRRVFLV